VFQLRLFIFKRDFIKKNVSADSEIALATETRRSEGQWLGEKLNNNNSINK
jgi:hypothetical protein